VRFLGGQTGPNPTDRAKLGSKRHLICDGRGIPLAIQLTAANRNDSQQALSLVDAVPLLQGERGRPRYRPDCVLGDRGYDAEAIRRGPACSPHLTFACNAQHKARQWAGTIAMGRRANLRVVVSIPAAARSL
jgi:transposase